MGSKVQFWVPISLCLCAFLGLEKKALSHPFGGGCRASTLHCIDHKIVSRYRGGSQLQCRESHYSAPLKIRRGKVP